MHDRERREQIGYLYAELISWCISKFVPLKSKCIDLPLETRTPMEEGVHDVVPCHTCGESHCLLCFLVIPCFVNNQIEDYQVDTIKKIPTVAFMSHLN